MKRIAIVAPSAALEGEKGYSRFRVMAEILSDYYDVDLIVSTFQHWEKKQRDITKDYGKHKYNILFAQAPSYKKNVDIRRFYSQYKNANEILKLVKSKDYDLIYNVIPGNRKARLLAEYARNNGKKSIIDVEDLWPEAMEMVSPFPGFINKIIFRKFRSDAKKAYMNSDGVIGTSDEYRDIPKNKYGVDIPKKETVYVGYEYNEYFSGVQTYSNEINKGSNDFWVIYAGTLGSSYDIETLIKAAQKIKADGYENIKFKILGGGPLSDKFKSIAAEQPCEVEFVGYVPYGKMAAYLCKSDITVNSFVKKAPQSIVTKIGDYLAAEKPMINTLSSPEFCTKVESDGFGINVVAEDCDALVKAIIYLYDNPDIRDVMGKKAKIIAEEQFDRRNSYLTVYRMIKELIGQ